MKKVSQLNNSLLLLMFLVPLCTGCLSIKRLQNKKMLKKAEMVCNECNSYNISSKDTIVVTKEGLNCLYEENSLQSAGKLVKKNKEGKWYFFDKNCKVDRVVKYSITKNDSTILYRAYTVNESW